MRLSQGKREGHGIVGPIAVSETSYRTILRSSSIIGAAQIVNILSRLVKMKIVAVLLGPTGVGFVGLFVSLIETAAAVAALGWGNAAIRQVSAAHAEGDEQSLARTRRALFLGSIGLAALGALLFWLLSDWITAVIVGEQSTRSEVAWLSLGIGFTVFGSIQIAVLSGLRRIGQIAKVNAAAGVISALLGGLAVWHWGREGLIALVLLAPASTFLLSILYVARLPSPAVMPPLRLKEIPSEWRSVTAIGFAFMFSTLITAGSHLTARSLIQNELGTASLGHFQAAWAIGVTYLGFVLTAMGTDYFARLSGVVKNHDASKKLVNEQTEVALLLCCPALVALIGVAPWFVTLLYSSEFGPAAQILQWQILGDILKLLCWPLGIYLAAAGAGRAFVFSQIMGLGTFLLGIVIGLPVLGVIAAGIAYIGIYAVILPINFFQVRRRFQFGWSKAVMLQGIGFIGAAILVKLAAAWSPMLGAALGLFIASIFGLWSLARISELAQFDGRLGNLGLVGKKLKTWMIRS
ncbi:MAG: O-antigen translocase [Pseudomonadota bacterium]